MEDNRNYVICAKCDEKIFYSDDVYEQDDCYDFEGSFYCEDCFIEVAKCCCYKALTDSSQYENMEDY